MVWRIARVSKPGREYRAMLESEYADKVYVHYLEARSWESRPRWKSEQTGHVVRHGYSSIMLRELDPPARAGLDRYLARLARLTQADWHVDWLADLRREASRYRARLLASTGARLILDYYQPPKESRPRWIKRYGPRSTRRRARFRHLRITGGRKHGRERGKEGV